MRFDDDDAIDVDEALDQLTELIVVPNGSPTREVLPAIVLPSTGRSTRPPVHKSQRPVLLVMPYDLASLGEAPKARKRIVRRTVQLSSFAPKRSQRRVDR